jgi:FHA domain
VDDDTDITVMKLPSAGSGDQPAGRTGWLPAALCASRHANPPEAERCRVCGADLSGAAHEWIERPVLGRLRFDRDFGVVDVTGPMVIGRKPRADKVPGDAVPQMVTIADNDVSKSHLQITVEGWHVIVTDLQSTNKTWAYDPDGEGGLLVPGMEKLLLPGSRVVMAESVGFVFEVRT